MRLLLLLFFGALLLMISACNAPIVKKDYYALPALTEEGVNAVIEIPAGSNLKLEYNPKKRQFLPDTLNGKARIIDFLGYPGNYGFIPSTYMGKESGGDGDPLDVLVLSPAQPTGSVISILPIGLLELMDEGELDTKIIAVPADPAQRSIQAANFQEFLLRYDGARRIVETWFLQYDGIGKTEFRKWDDELSAMAEIEKWIQ